MSRTIEASPAEVFAQLADGWIYSSWVVGASHIRDVDAGWPGAGTRIHHRVGPWPATIDDTTEVLEVVVGSRLVLQARAWPAGEARVELTIAPAPEGSLVTMSEAPTRGVGTWLDNPLQRWILRRRNIESLARLASIAERRPLPASGSQAG
ncbi:SRPBCC family protein [Jatrophihabitans sp.]|uniref:SRPBCC family protein n=1 Tax=Jatrophihabitans sp. TaxID=1932789 RepID=UPI0030C65CB2